MCTPLLTHLTPILYYRTVSRGCRLEAGTFYGLKHGLTGKKVVAPDEQEYF